MKQTWGSDKYAVRRIFQCPESGPGERWLVVLSERSGLLFGCDDFFIGSLAVFRLDSCRSNTDQHYHKTLFVPESIAVSGAGERANSVGAVVLNNLLEGVLAEQRPLLTELQSMAPS
jgi:hypothetical protein